MDKEKIMLAMDCMEGELVAEASETAKAAQKYSWRRAAVIAACLCLVLAGTVSAINTALRVDFFGGADWFDWLGRQQIHPEEAGAFWPNSTVRVPMEEFSDAVRQMAAEEPADHVNVRGFDSWEEIENFIGLEVANNSLLESAEKTGIKFYFNDELRAEGNALLDVRTDLNYLELSADYRLYGTNQVRVQATVISEQIPRETDFLEYGMAIAYTEDMTAEEYTMANGRLATIVSTPGMQEDGTLGAMYYYAVFQGDNAVIRVESSDLADKFPGMDHMRQQDALTTLKEVLDAFE